MFSIWFNIAHINDVCVAFGTCASVVAEVFEVVLVKKVVMCRLYPCTTVASSSHCRHRRTQQLLLAMEDWSEDMNHGIHMSVGELIRLPDTIEVEQMYINENKRCEQMHQCVQQVCTKAQELVFQVEHSGKSRVS